MSALRAHTIASKTEMEMWWFASGASGSTTWSLVGASVRGAMALLALLVLLTLLVLLVPMVLLVMAVEGVNALRMWIVGMTQPPHVRSA